MARILNLLIVIAAFGAVWAQGTHRSIKVFKRLHEKMIAGLEG